MCGRLYPAAAAPAALVTAWLIEHCLSCPHPIPSRGSVGASVERCSGEQLVCPVPAPVFGSRFSSYLLGWHSMVDSLQSCVPRQLRGCGWFCSGDGVGYVAFSLPISCERLLHCSSVLQLQRGTFCAFAAAAIASAALVVPSRWATSSDSHLSVHSLLMTSYSATLMPTRKQPGQDHCYAAGRTITI